MTILLAAITAAALTCDPSLWKATYHHQRFTVIAKCKSFSGTIEHERAEADGDLHIQLRLDPGQGKPLKRREREETAVLPCGGAGVRPESEAERRYRRLPIGARGEGAPGRLTRHGQGRIRGGQRA